MSLGTIVMKFGGTSVADAERLKRAAARIVAKREDGNRVVAVLSARGKRPTALIARTRSRSPEHPHPREMDMLLSTGERRLLRAVRDGDQRPRAPRDLADRLAGRASSPTRRTRRPGSSTCAPTGSWTRSTRTRSSSSRASRASRPRKDVTTLGRGGSDTTAVALAAAVGAEVCEIYTDVAGVFSADPRIVPDARKLDVVSFEEMLEMSGLGRRRPAAARGRVRAQPRRAHPLPVELRRRAGTDRRLGEEDRGTPARSPPSPTRPARPASR